MGGSIQFVLRDTDGTVYKRITWTNSLPYFLNDIRTIKKDRSNFDDLLNDDNYLDIEESENKIAPISYGIVVVDWKLNKISACNGYTTPGFCSKYLFTNPDSYGGEIKQQLIDLINANKIVAAVLPDYNGVIITFKDVINLQIYYIRLDFSPVELFNFAESPNGFENMKQMLIQDGFDINPKEWDDFIKEREE